jgi:DNA-binding protein
MSEEHNEVREESKPVESKSNDNSIFIGGKPFMNYVTGVVMQFNSHGAKEVIVKSRGKFIAKAVDVAEVARRKFLTEQNVSIKDVKIGSEEFENKEGRVVNVSILEITLGRD